MDRVPNALEAYRNAHQLYAEMGYAEMGLEADVQECDNAFHLLSSVPEPLRRKPHNPFVRFWRWLKQWVRTFLG
ncbi:MAG: hypothetical protein MH252_00300 [Thermosynechococcaceae cyanobacterium MS004]|nr:hypothetical protein [Thermosynechococcaceae cyanobacterium MS004]